MGIGYLHTSMLHAERHLHVFGVVSFLVISDLIKDAATEYGEWTGSDIERIELGEDAAQEHAEDVLHFLQALDDGARIVDMERRYDGHDGLIFKSSDDAHEGVGSRVGVGIEAADEGGAAMFDGHIESGMFAAVFFVEYVNVGVASECLESLRGAISGAVVHQDDGESVLRIVESEEGGDGFAHGSFFVVAGHDDGHGRKISMCHSDVSQAIFEAFAVLYVGDEHEHLEVEGQEKGYQDDDIAGGFHADKYDMFLRVFPLARSVLWYYKTMHSGQNINDLTRQPPRSPKTALGGFVILPRAIDKCRATLNGKEGEYEFDCQLDNFLFGFKGVKGSEFKEYVREGHSDQEILEWVRLNGVVRSEADISEWSNKMLKYAYLDNPEDREWLEEQNLRLGLDKGGFLFDYLETDDRVSFAK